MGKGKHPKGWHFKGRLDGVEATVAALRKYPPAVQNRVLKKALTKGAQITTKAAKTLVPTQSKQLKKSLGYKVWVGKTKGKVIAFIGPRLGFRATYKGRPRDPRYYAHLVERGRKALKPSKKTILVGLPAAGKSKAAVQWYGRHVAAAPPKRPLARAFKQTKGQVESTMVGVMREGMEKEAAKIAAKKA